MVSNSGAWVQRSWQIGLNGKPESVGEMSVDFVMGSGTHVRNYLHRSARNTLIELPLAWYAENGGKWALNPGFDTANPFASRKVGYDCMFCHNGYPSIPAGHDEAGAEPVFAGASFELGLLQSDLGNKPLAIEALRKAVALNPEFADGHNTLGAVLAKTGRQDEAEAEFRTALRLHPPLPGAHGNLANILANVNQLAEALRHFDRAGDGAMVQFNYGVTLARANRL